MHLPDTLHYKHWSVEQPPKGVVLLVHGLGEHCGRYTKLANYLNENNYALCAIDLPGHGKSAGLRGHINRFSDYTEAVMSLRKQITEWYPDRPVFLLGHSMGGLISTRLLIDQQQRFSGALLSGAAIQSPQVPPAFQLAIVRFISWLLPKVGILTLDASGISRTPAVVEQYMNDPLVNKGKLSARLITEMFSTMDNCKARAAEIKLPIKIMHGSADVMTAPTGSEYLYQHISSKDKSLTIYDGLFHEIFNEPEAPNIYAEIVDWLNRH